MTDLSQQFLRRLAGVCDQLATETGTCWTYGQDNSRRHRPPDAVAFATSHEQVCHIVGLCHESRVPLVARGRGTGTCGGAVPVAGGVVLSLERMNRIIDIDAANRVMVVEPGVTNREVQDAAAQFGLFWPPDPTSAEYCSVGGNIAFNSAGPRAVKYGTTRDNVLGLRAVTGTGSGIRTGVYTTKGVVGYDLTRLIIGSEGTLAIVTEAILKLTPTPGANRTLRALYGNVDDATRAVVRIMGQPEIPAALEFMDSAALDLIRDDGTVQLPQEAGAMLLIEVDGSEATLESATAAISTAATGTGLLQLDRAADADQGRQLWAARKALSPALRRIAPNKLNEDVVVPVSRIPKLIDGLRALSERHGIPIVNFGHAGNGNIHVNLLYDTLDPQQAEHARPCLDEVFRLVLELGGTLSGEHGVGTEKRDYVGLEIDPPTLELMRAIKREFDPAGILNPGKLLPVAGA